MTTGISLPDKLPQRINIDEPRWNQGTYWGRARHFFLTTNPLNSLCTSAELAKAQDIVVRYRNGETIPELTEERLWRAKNIYDSAFHPETGEKMLLIGRMSAQVPMNMTITGCMLTFYKSPAAVIFWQWGNQSFNAVVNYSNRSGDAANVQQLGLSYVLATGGALGTALGLNSIAKKAPALIGRLVPFAAVAAANCVNIPMMRMQEIQEGIQLVDESGNPIGKSVVAARHGIAQVILSRIAMCVPTMVVPALFMDQLDKRGILRKYPSIGAPLQVLLCGLSLTFATPMCCALFPQKASITVSTLEPELQERINQLPKAPQILYYNKGL